MTGTGNATAGDADGAAEAYPRAVRADAARPRAGVTATDIDDEIILYNPLDGSTHALNVTAALIWDLCDGTRTPGDIAGEVAATFGIPAAAARADADALIAQLYKLGLLDPEPTSDE